MGGNVGCWGIGIGTGTGGAMTGGATCSELMRSWVALRKPRPGCVGIWAMLLIRSVDCLNQRSAEYACQFCCGTSGRSGI
jgi:hypothetical protein